MPVLTAEMVPILVAKGRSARRSVPAPANFKPGQRVRARNMHPKHHTRIPRYVRGHVGVVERDHGVFVFSDTNADLAGENPQRVYSVRFAARELWGADAAAADAVYVDLFDSYLEPA